MQSVDGLFACVGAQTALLFADCGDDTFIHELAQNAVHCLQAFACRLRDVACADCAERGDRVDDGLSARWRCCWRRWGIAGIGDGRCLRRFIYVGSHLSDEPGFHQRGQYRTDVV